MEMKTMDEELLAPIEEACEVDDVTTPATSDAELEMPGVNHSDIAKDFLTSEWGKDYYRVYDVKSRPVASWTGTRWVLADDTDLLRSRVRDYLDRLHDSLPPPPKGRDYRKKLKSAPFCRDVTTEILIKLTPIRQDAFDRNEYLLGLDDGKVAELITGVIREMRREDFISRRVYFLPDPDRPTPRWSQFLDQITLGNIELQKFLMRLCALCLTAHAFQGLFFLWGRGRNGKGVLLRLLGLILGPGLCTTFRPNELTVSRYEEDKAKRSLNKLEGVRLATVDESLGSNLNLSLLKLMSGGDMLSAARMRQDERQFKPTHKLVLPTNEKPQLPNDPAFRGRVYFIPFLADFSDRSKQDPLLEKTLAAEAPGIVAQLIALCPDVIANGLQPPAIVKDATSELLEEGDLAKQFEEDMLIKAPGQNISFEAMDDAVQSWLIGAAPGGLTVRSYGQNRETTQIMADLKARYPYKRLRPEGKSGRRVYFFLNVSLVPKEGS
jgi:P4 family phage/plasmid primase-like protien